MTYLKPLPNWTKIVKIIFSVLFCAALCSNSVFAADEAKKGPFYLALSSMSRDIAAYTFMLDELLTARCGASPSIVYLKTASESYIYVLLALKDGNTADAKARLLSIPCEKASR